MTDKESEFTCIEYEYDGDKLLSYGTEICDYDEIGNPKTYRGKKVEWANGRQMVSYNGTAFTYDGLGRRISKGDISYIYDSNNRIIKQSNGIEFIYDNSGVAGIVYSGETYLYRKDAQGNIVGLIDNNGNVVVEYKYDAWGNHEVYDGSGTKITQGTHVGRVNPYRYRGYYYDEELKLYYLKTRYYDPEVGRFINADDITYIDPETINGLNLYAYCGNNPVMNVDPNGTFFWLAFLAIIGISALVGGVIGGVSGGVTAAMNGQDFWLGFAAGAIGGAVGGVLAALFPTNPWAAIGGRLISSGLYGIFNELFQNGSLENMDWALWSADLFMDFAFSLLYVGFGSNIGTSIVKMLGMQGVKIFEYALPSTIVGLIDMIVDIIENIFYFSPNAQKRIRKVYC